MPYYKLTYFNLRELAEGARLILKYSGTDFDDIRLPMDEWEKIKPGMPFRQVPILEVDGVIIPQSTAIYRFLGQQFGRFISLSANSAICQVDFLVGCRSFFSILRTASWPLYNPYKLIYFFKNAYSTEKPHLPLKESAIPARDVYFSGLTTFLKQSGSGYLVGKKLSWADIVIGNHLDGISDFFPNLYEGYPEVKDFVSGILEIPAIKKWIEQRPKTPF
ncbi:unnamed protein product [Enterobius vermicularis]|uniref:Glutathione S-transferase 1 n=1 Tax=Enterobius vermicularis TaxID=51028 RepID=A0A0N4VNH9_ENTVE|nr:unnamed protein product [Enterobius vermicularis]